MTDEIRRIDLGGGARADLATKADLERLGAELKAAIADSRRRTLTAVTRPLTLYCSFYGKSQHEVKKLIAGSAEEIRARLGSGADIVQTFSGQKPQTVL